jgi:hypothetical protein
VKQTDWITTVDAARVLGVDKRRLQAWVFKGQVAPAAKAPGYRGAMLWTRATIEKVAAWRGVDCDWTQLGQ